MSKPTIIVNMKYKGRWQVRSLRNLCKYLQYRDGSVRRDAYLRGEGYGERNDYIRPEEREAKWVDRGMGETYHQIANQANDWQGRSVLARTWVISPDPELMRHVPKDLRFDLVRRVTETSIERWYGDNGWGQPDYSYVIHDKHRAADAEQMVHAHVVTPGTVPVDAAGEMGRIDHIVKRPHIRHLHRTAGRAFEHELERILGRDRAQEIIRERDTRLEQIRNKKYRHREQIGQIQKVQDVLYIMQAEKARKEAKEQKRKHKRTARMKASELRIYTRYVTQDRRNRRQRDYDQRQLVREQTYREELSNERDRHQQRIDRIVAGRQRVPTYGEQQNPRDSLAREEALERDAMLRFHAALVYDRERGIMRDDLALDFI